tara:strand:- start:1991 stop:2332 length:342 start_codon:yes stop_codon:yes gene_type:complete
MDKLRAKWKKEKQERDNQALHIVETHGNNVQILMSEIVGLVNYYRVYRSRTKWETMWSNDGTTFLDKLISSLLRNAKQLPLENPETFAKDVAKFIKDSWTARDSGSKKKRKRT